MAPVEEIQLFVRDASGNRTYVTFRELIDATNGATVNRADLHISRSRDGELVSLKRGADRDASMVALKAEYPVLAGFEREFPSVCFALATGVGKTRLMARSSATCTWRTASTIFFVLAPNLTIYNKLIARNV